MYYDDNDHLKLKTILTAFIAADSFYQPLHLHMISVWKSVQPTSHFSEDALCEIMLQEIFQDHRGMRKKVKHQEIFSETETESTFALTYAHTRTQITHTNTHTHTNIYRERPEILRQFRETIQRQLKTYKGMKSVCYFPALRLVVVAWQIHRQSV